MDNHYTKQTNEINDRLLRLEEINSVPSFAVEEEKCIFPEYSENHIFLKVTIRNLSNGVIDIISVSDMNIHICLTDRFGVLNFNTVALKYQTLLPQQEKQLDFSIIYRGDKLELCTRELIRNLKCQLVFDGEFDITYKYKDSQTTYKETIKIAGYGKFLISNDVSIKEHKITRSDYKIERLEN